jgi:hypothetical protein
LDRRFFAWATLDRDLSLRGATERLAAQDDRAGGGQEAAVRVRSVDGRTAIG